MQVTITTMPLVTQKVATTAEMATVTLERAPVPVPELVAKSLLSSEQTQ